MPSLMSTLALAGLLREAAPAIEAALGAPLRVDLAPTRVLEARIRAGDRADAAALTAEAIAALSSEGVLDGTTARPLAQSRVGVAVRAGARQVECTINGIGERAGNTSLEEVVMALKVRREHFHDHYCNVNTTLLTKASRLVAAVSGMAVQSNKAIVGANAFAHESGIHQDGMLKNLQTFEIMRPEDVGLQQSRLVLGKLSGRHAFVDKLAALGYQLPDAQLEEAFQRFKALADKKKQVFDDDLIALIDDEIAQANHRLKFVSLTVACGSFGPQRAEMVVEVGEMMILELLELVELVDTQR
jgi:2-isopropylmalate synthase